MAKAKKSNPKAAEPEAAPAIAAPAAPTPAAPVLAVTPAPVPAAPEKAGTPKAAAPPEVAPAAKGKKAGGAKKVAKVEAAAPAATPATPKAPVTPAIPLVDTNLAARAAATMLVNRESLAAAGKATGKPESGAFKQMKQGLNKPSTGLTGAHGLPTDTKRRPQGFGGSQNVRNQTFGADVNRTGVPRRTGG